MIHNTPINVNVGTKPPRALAINDPDKAPIQTLDKSCHSFCFEFFKPKKSDTIAREYGNISTETKCNPGYTSKEQRIV